MNYPTLLMAAASALAVTACSDKTPTAAGTEAAAEAASGDTVAALIDGSADHKTLAGALKSTGIDGVFGGKGDYTVLAPSDAAFTALGDKAATLTAPEQKAVLAAILRDHVIPGTLTPADIGKAIDASSGKSVTMRTVGSGSVTFTRDGDAIAVASSDGAKAKVLGAGSVGSNGAVLPVDTLLKKV
ncbi:putative surface protein with fasciclin (FAS1) repeats [Novosphingobium kunmingense]|uniref:Putative surface protein with fasciclin (FAS1) repeats n=1 Tax=Novosphingobium kunmingense TaxID=1211806 RepID=A0A2N0HKR7_9SPHN|nr:fasciclin domain-containing protein [Novosphingobium kunmingense]PKB19540.1 putative surface protein with fasciclin (FAS1) repeats [Novosphingobium kunmingense]